MKLKFGGIILAHQKEKMRKKEQGKNLLKMKSYLRRKLKIYVYMY